MSPPVVCHAPHGSAGHASDWNSQTFSTSDLTHQTHTPVHCSPTAGLWRAVGQFQDSAVVTLSPAALSVAAPPPAPGGASEPGLHAPACSETPAGRKGEREGREGERERGGRGEGGGRKESSYMSALETVVTTLTLDSALASSSFLAIISSSDSGCMWGRLVRLYWNIPGYTVLTCLLAGGCASSSSSSLAIGLERGEGHHFVWQQKK